MKKLPVTVVIIAIIAIGGYFFLNNEAPPEKITESELEEETIAEELVVEEMKIEIPSEELGSGGRWFSHTPRGNREFCKKVSLTNLNLKSIVAENIELYDCEGPRDAFIFLLKEGDEYSYDTKAGLKFYFTAPGNVYVGEQKHTFSPGDSFISIASYNLTEEGGVENYGFQTKFNRVNNPEWTNEQEFLTGIQKSLEDSLGADLLSTETINIGARQALSIQ